MVSHQVYYATIAQKKRELDTQFPAGFCTLMSVYSMTMNTTAGSISEVSNALAAKFLVDASHRLLTPEEEKAYLSLLDNKRADIAKQEEKSVANRVANALNNVSSGPVVPPVAPPVKK